MSNRTPPSVALLTAAKNGSLDALQAVSMSLPDHYSIEILDLLLTQMDVNGYSEVEKEELFQSRNLKSGYVTFEELQHIDKAKAATAGLVSLLSLGEALQIHPALREGTILRLRKALPDIVIWMLWSLNCDPALKRTNSPYQLDLEVEQKRVELNMYLVLLTIANHLLTLDVRLRNMFLQLEGAIEVLVILWMHTSGGEPLWGGSQTTQIHREDNRLLAYMHAALTENADMVFDVITRERIRTVDAFVALTLKMVRKTIDRNKTWAYTRYITDETYDIPTVGLLVEIGNVLVREPRIRDTFFKRGGIALYAKCTMLVRWRIDMDRTTAKLPHTTHWMSHILLWSVSSSGYLLSNISAMVKEGLLAVIQDSFEFPFRHEGFTSSKSSSTSTSLRSRAPTEIRKEYQVGMVDPCTAGPAENAALMLSILLDYVEWPRYQPNFHFQAKQKPISKFTKKDDDRSVLYIALMVALEKRSKFFLKKNWDAVCDNLEHYDTNGSTSHPTRQKTCSRCHSVVYCSSECQKQDWMRRHGKECSSAHVLHIQGMHTDGHYSHHSRMFQLSVLLESFEDRFSDICLRGFGSEQSQTEPTHEIWCLDFCKGTPATACALGEWKSEYSESIPPYLQPRFDDMVKTWLRSHTPVMSATSEAARPLRLVDARYQYGPQVLHLVVLIRKLETPIQYGESLFGYEAAASLAFTTGDEGPIDVTEDISSSNDTHLEPRLTTSREVIGVSLGGWLSTCAVIFPVVMGCILWRLNVFPAK